MIQSLVLRWLRWRYGGDVHALKCPIGYCRRFAFIPLPPLRRRVAYWFSYRFWRFENLLFERYGQPMRDAWEASFNC